MNHRFTLILMALALIVVLGVTNTEAAPKETVRSVAPPGIYVFTNDGTDWTPEVLGQYNWWHARGWGTQAKPKTTGPKWVHISIPIAEMVSLSNMYVETVGFCARSSNGAGGTGPSRIDIYNDDTLFTTQNISWWTDNDYHCPTFNLTPTMFEAVSISLSLNFAHTTDMITLGMAFVWTAP